MESVSGRNGKRFIFTFRDDGTFVGEIGKSPIQKRKWLIGEFGKFCTMATGFRSGKFRYQFRVTEGLSALSEAKKLSIK